MPWWKIEAALLNSRRSIASGRVRPSEGGAAAQARRGEVGIDDPVPEVERHLVNRGAVGDAGVVDEHIDNSEAFDGVVEQGLDGGLVRHVGRHSERFAAHRHDLRDERFEALGPPRGKHDLGALAREGQRARLANSRARPGHHDHASLQYAHRHPFRLSFARGLNQAGGEAKPSIERKVVDALGLEPRTR